MKPVGAVLVICLLALVTSAAAFLAGSGGVGTVAGIVALTAGGSGLAWANDASRHHG